MAVKSDTEFIKSDAKTVKDLLVNELKRKFLSFIARIAAVLIYSS